MPSSKKNDENIELRDISLDKFDEITDIAISYGAKTDQHVGRKILPQLQQHIKDNLVVDSILRNCADEGNAKRALAKIGQSFFSGVAALFSYEGKFGEKGFAVTINIPGRKEKKFKLIHAYKHGPTFWNKEETQCHKLTGFKALAYEEVDSSGEVKSDRVKIFFPGLDWNKQDVFSVVWSLVVGSIHFQVPAAAGFLDELLAMDELKTENGQKKILDITGNSLGSQSAIYATAYVGEKGYKVSTKLIDAFAPGLALIEVSRQLADHRNRTNNDGENARYTYPLEIKDEIEKKITTLNIFPPTMATNIWPWLDAPDFTRSIGKSFRIVVKDDELIDLFKGSFGIIWDKEGTSTPIRQRITSLPEKWKLAKSYYNNTHLLTSMTNIMLEPGKVEIVVGPRVSNNGMINGTSDTGLRGFQLTAHAIAGQLSDVLIVSKKEATLVSRLKFADREKLRREEQESGVQR